VIQSFVDWFDKSGFYTKTVWDIEQGQWIGAGLMQLFPHQRRILEHVFTQREDGTFPYTTIVYSAVKKSGKAVWVETPIATPTGWKTMGDLQEGDQVFDECGKPCRVIFATDVMYDHPCYRVEFSNGEVIIADAEHQWYVGGRMKAGKSLRDRQCLYWHLTTTEVMAKTVIAPWDKNLRMYSLPVTHPLELPDAPLPVPPYTLGAWLGDGSSDCAMLTVGHGDEEILAIISTEGVPVHAAKHTDRTPRYSLTNRSLQRCSVGTALRDEGLLHNKHIPPIYFRASLAQRLELLRGLMDTDGYISKDGRCEFTSTSKRLARDLQELLATLGIKAKVTESEAKLNGVVISPKYRVHFQSYQDLPVFHLTRKCERLVPRKKAVTRSELVRVVSITPIESVPVRCIQVDSPSHLYLVGRTLIPTHNTQMGAAIGSWAGECFPENSEIFAMANDKEQAQGISFADIDYHAARKLGIAATRDRLNYPNGTFIQVIANQYASAAGSRHAMCLWDELWGYRTEKDRRMWAEMTPPPSIPHAMRVITTYAGFENESDLLLSLYNACFKKEGGKFVHGEVVPELADIVDARGESVCRRNGRTFVYWDTEPRMPWQTEAYYCLPLPKKADDLMVLTGGGWKAAAEVTVNDSLCTRNNTTGHIEYQQPTTIFRAPYNGKLLRLKNTKADLVMTPNHRVYAAYANHTRKVKNILSRPFVYEYREAQDASRAQVGWIPGHGDWDHEPLPYITIGEHSYDGTTFIEFLAWFLSEGHVVYYKYASGQRQASAVFISQSPQINPEKYQLIQHICTQMGVKFSSYGNGVHIFENELAVWCSQFGHSQEKFIPRFVLDCASRTQLRLFFDAYVLGDGTTRESGEGFLLYTNSNQMRLDLMELVFKAGYRPRYLGAWSSAPEKGRAPIHHISVLPSHLGWSSGNKRQPWKEEQATEGTEVWCPTVPNSNFYVMQNGVCWWTGNSEQASDPSMRASDFLRYHRNQWVTSNESFIPIELWERAEKKLQGPITIVKDTEQASLPISVGIDIGVKHDCSALVGVYYDVKRRKAGIAFHRIWTPPKRNDKEAEILDLEYTVELELTTLWKQYRIVSVVYDPMQFQRSAMTLARKGMPLVEFQQQGSHMIAASQNLYDLLKTGNLEAYYDPELRDHIRYAAAETTARGFRLVKGKGKYAIDAAVALAMAAFDAVNRGGGDTTTPFEMIMPFSDASAVHIPNANDVYTRALPEALRD
jgi:hypothetical protein